MRRMVSTVPVVLFLAACAGGNSSAPPPEPAPPPPLDPVGVYDCSLDVEGMALSAVLSISGEPGAYTGSVDSDMGPAPVRDIAVSGNEMTFSVDTPEMLVFFAVVFDGQDFAGEFDAGGMAGFISGKRR